jgi:GNAT superfamily N-acetyltransferase
LRSSDDGERVRLRDGATVLIRPVRPDDRPLFVAGFERLGEQSRYARFLGLKKRLRDDELRFFTDVDHRDHEALGAIDEASGEGVGVARMIRLPDRHDVAEAAVAVVDDWQGRGVGKALLERLVARARALGVTHFQATLLTRNKAMLSLFDRLGCMRSRRDDHDVQTIDVELPAEGREGALGAALRIAARGGQVFRGLTHARGRP